MQWVLSQLKRLLRKEQMFGNKHTPLAGDRLYNISARFSKERIPQLKAAIEILESNKEPKSKAAKKIKNVPDQLNLFK
jgi:hypothetical protein